MPIRIFFSFLGRKGLKSRAEASLSLPMICSKVFLILPISPFSIPEKILTQRQDRFQGVGHMKRLTEIIYASPAIMALVLL
jgi:hypothetical protein